MKYSSSSAAKAERSKEGKLPVGEEKCNDYLSSGRFFPRTVCRAMLALPFKEPVPPFSRAEKEPELSGQRAAMKTSKIESKHHYRAIQFNVARVRVILIGTFPAIDSLAGAGGSKFDLLFECGSRIDYRDVKNSALSFLSFSFFMVRQAEFEHDSNVESRKFPFCSLPPRSPLKSITRLPRRTSFGREGVRN